MLTPIEKIRRVFQTVDDEPYVGLTDEFYEFINEYYYVSNKRWQDRTERDFLRLRRLAEYIAINPHVLFLEVDYREGTTAAREAEATFAFISVAKLRAENEYCRLYSAPTTPANLGDDYSLISLAWGEDPRVALANYVKDKGADIGYFMPYYYQSATDERYDFVDRYGLSRHLIDSHFREMSIVDLYKALSLQRDFNIEELARIATFCEKIDHAFCEKDWQDQELLTWLDALFGSYHELASHGELSDHDTVLLIQITGDIRKPM
jgi:hypothetical protein